MAGTGKYTTYVPVQPPGAKYNKMDLLRALYPGGDATKLGTTSPVLHDLQGKSNAEVAAYISTFGNTFIYGFDGDAVGSIGGDPDFFPGGFFPDFSGKGLPFGIPDKHSPDDIGNGQFKNPGDAATPFYPDVRSPIGGPGTVDPLKKTGPIPDPLGNYVQYKPSINVPTSEGTRNPYAESTKIHNAVKLGQYMAMGSSYPSTKPTT